MSSVLTCDICRKIIVEDVPWVAVRVESHGRTWTTADPYPDLRLDLHASCYTDHLGPGIKAALRSDG